MSTMNEFGTRFHVAVECSLDDNHTDHDRIRNYKQKVILKKTLRILRDSLRMRYVFILKIIFLYAITNVNNITLSKLQLKKKNYKWLY